MIEYEAEHNSLIKLLETQSSYKFSPSVLTAMSAVKRHLFIPKENRREAYSNHAVLIGYGQTISQPLMVAIMTEELKLTGSEKVLEIGTGSGYQAAILSHLCGELYSVERLEVLAESARKRLRKLNITNFYIKNGDGTIGWSENAPYDRIIVTAAAPHVPVKLLSQLSKDGLLVIPVGNQSVQRLYIVSKDQEGITQVRKKGSCVFVPLIGEDGWKRQDR